MSSLYIIGTGPGAVCHLTDAAKDAITLSDTIVGYDSYIELVRPLLSGKEIISTGMTMEVERCSEAIRLARNGKTVALVSGGDAGIYGMAGLVYELLERELKTDKTAVIPNVQVIPGISAIQAAAAALGAPLMHDFAVISLSDLLTPWELIKKRLQAAAAADFVIVIFNPRSKSRVTQIEEAQRIILASRSPLTPTGIVRNASRDGETVTVTTLEEMLDHEIDMSSIVIVGNSESFIDHQSNMVTPRGYSAKLEVASSNRLKKEDLANPGAVMFCGTASDVGKSVLTAGFCRYLANTGIRVAPFKSQNMSLNSFVTPEGGEIGRAQATQAEACRIPPNTDMNPVLLKPNSDTGSQVIVQGRAIGNMNVREYDSYKPQLLPKVQESFEQLKKSHDFIVLEGAGSISEINLRDKDIANLKMAAMARCPVILVADIDRGGVFAQITGTIELLEPHERSCIKGIIINKFRGDVSILAPGIDFITKRTGIPLLGVVPWLPDLRLPDEDSVALAQQPKTAMPCHSSNLIRIGVVRLPRISNFTDFDALKTEPDVIISYLEKVEQLDKLDLLILPGSKSTIADLNYLKERGWFEALKSFKGRIIGICGGYQMLGRRVSDPYCVESEVKEAAAIDLLPVETTLQGKKETHQVTAKLVPSAAAFVQGSEILTGYEIHMGHTTPLEKSNPFTIISSRGENPVNVEDGFVSPDSRIIGTYIHGLFDNESFRTAYLDAIRIEKGLEKLSGHIRPCAPDPFDLLADHLEKHLDISKLMQICGLDCASP